MLPLIASKEGPVAKDGKARRGRTKSADDSTTQWDNDYQTYLTDAARQASLESSKDKVRNCSLVMQLQQHRRWSVNRDTWHYSLLNTVLIIYAAIAQYHLCLYFFSSFSPSTVPTPLQSPRERFQSIAIFTLSMIINCLGRRQNSR